MNDKTSKNDQKNPHKESLTRTNRTRLSYLTGKMPGELRKLANTKLNDINAAQQNHQQVANK